MYVAERGLHRTVPGNRLEGSSILASTTKEESMPRELIDTGTDKRYVRRDSEGRFKESDDVGRSSAADQRQDAKTKSKKGEGDRGDR
jgi:hypothetical protein